MESKNSQRMIGEAIRKIALWRSGSSEGGVLLGYLKKTGTLRANYGFEAGMGNVRLLKTYQDIADDGVTPIYGLQAFGDIRI